MKIYTKTGDKGETSLFGGERVLKDTRRIEAYGTIDELNSHIGLVRSMKPPQDIDLILEDIQEELFVLGADLATPPSKNAKKVARLEPRHAQQIEKIIDRIDSELKPLKEFILPGGSIVASHLHVARTVCRRAERSVVQLFQNGEIGTTPLVYLNRLSDLLFVMARYANTKEKRTEVKWDSGRTK